ncbi:hypothetical protein BVC80_1805g98 [Macleaya cordata]|uniref:DUF8204 domain-containing protein n=1 Tax=Macleaya cordata TaxID=56857 RepID=A0A200QQX9_MACCD|nr:hypothetical protein BVC80_1805g98 [Macleaya cordata]
MEGSESSGKEDDGDQKKILQGLKGKSCKVPDYVVRESDVEASKDARNLTEFKYACVGYSVYLDNKDPSADPIEKRAELPFCVGVELLLDKRPSTAAHVPARVHNKEGLVASGVARNLHRVGDYVKDSLDDILYPYRRRPK